MSTAPLSGGRDGKRRVRLSGKNSFGIAVDTSALDAYLAQLEGATEEAVRPVAQAMAQVFYERVRLNVAGLGKVTGNLAGSIYQVYSKSNSTDGSHATYHVSWNHKKAPHGHLLEYGWLQRYRYYQGNDGRVRLMVRPGMEGEPRPGRHASDAQKAAYYVTLPTPIQKPGAAFIRRAAAAQPEAIKAGEAELVRRIQAIK